MEILKLYGIKEVSGKRVQCRPIDPDWESKTDNICEYHGCAFYETCCITDCSKIACAPAEREDGRDVFFREIPYCEDADCVHHACMSDDCMYDESNAHLGERRCGEN